MAQIKVFDPDKKYGTTIDTGVCDVEISKNYLGVGLVSDSGDRIGVSNRDDGFEILYHGRLYSFNNGTVS